MFYCDTIEKEVDYARKGYAKNVHITEEGNNIFAKIVYDEAKNELVVTEGSAIVCICEEIGIHEEAVVEFIPVDNNKMIVSLLEGNFYVKSAKGQCVQFDTEGNTVLYEPVKNRKKVYWFKASELRSIVGYKMFKEYNIPTDIAVPDRYFYNLRYTLRLSYLDNMTLSAICELVETTLGMSSLPEYKTVKYEPFKHMLQRKSTYVDYDDDEDEDEDETFGLMEDDVELDAINDDDEEDDDY